MPYASSGYNKYGRGNNFTQDQKALYDIRDNLESQSQRILRLARAIKQLHGDVKDVFDMFGESGYIPRNKLKREYPLSHTGGGQESSQVLQNNSAKDEGDGICKDKDRRRHRMEVIHGKGKDIHGEDVKYRFANNIAFLHGGNTSSDSSHKEDSQK